MLSANGGKLEYIKENCEGYSGNAAIKAKKCIDIYLYYAILSEMPEFLSKYKETINLKFEYLKYLEVNVPDIETQINIVQVLKEIDRAINEEENQIQHAKDIKKSFLGKMFV